MRIISGQLKGRILPKNSKLKARPTTDKAKESLFNILNFQIDYESTRVLDLFSGTGNISFEFASRGAQSVSSVEIRFEHFKHIKKLNIELGTNIKVIKADVFKYLRKASEQFDLVFADPPFDLEDIPRLLIEIESNHILAEGGLLIIEHGSNHNFSKNKRFLELRNYGKVNFSFFQF